jgi:hypothetical protein
MDTKKNDKLNLNPFQTLNIASTSRNFKPETTLTEYTDAPHSNKADQAA